MTEVSVTHVIIFARVFLLTLLCWALYKCGLGLLRSRRIRAARTFSAVSSVCVCVGRALRHDCPAYFLRRASPFDPARQKKGKDLRRLTVTGQGQTCSSANEDPKSIRPRSHLPFTLYCSTVVEAGLDSRSRLQIFKTRSTFSSLLKSPSTFLEGVENQK